jgi:hypothetical protein
MCSESSMGFEIGNKKSWGDVEGVATGTGTAFVTIVHRSHDPNPSVAWTDRKKGANADERRPPRLGDAHQHWHPSSRRFTQNRHPEGEWGRWKSGIEEASRE